ncbi:MAG: holo-ACP synthase [Oscillospiraceae bacterium]|nr:holo-ACP synthase [Oscillospiraceae bacterium]
MRVGIDCVDIARIEKSIEIPGFLERIFSENEIAMFMKKKMNPQTIAANFAAKEAFSKSLGTGIRGFKLKEVSVLRDELGAPYIELTGKAAEIAGNSQFTVSITHTETVATAIVIAY